MRGVQVIESRRLIVQKNILLFVARIDMQILQEENVRVVLPGFQMTVQLGVMVFGEVDHEVQLHFREAFVPDRTNSVPLSLSCDLSSVVS